MTIATDPPADGGRPWQGGAKSWLCALLGAEIRSVDIVQSLWSGYGEIARVHLDRDPADNRASAIVKWVCPQPVHAHPRGWSGRRSHDRKLRSYEVEQNFYRREHDDAPASASYRTARCLAITRRGDEFVTVLEDLDASGFGSRHAPPDVAEPEVHSCLEWLARFHAAHLGAPTSNLWPTGTYWHLATRPDEFAAMKDPELRRAAPLLDSMLHKARFRTLLHGDAKVANFCFGPSDAAASERIAAVDFQYVGGGPGIIDVAYCLSSCLDDRACEQRAEELLEHYFAALQNCLLAGRFAGAAAEVVAEWRALYPAAWADFHRFLDGWAPDHWKIHRYTRAMTRRALASLS
ncbi:MAG: oxidoreductase family protein [Planctomycetota bacterium]